MWNNDTHVIPILQMRLLKSTGAKRIGKFSCQLSLLIYLQFLTEHVGNLLLSLMFSQHQYHTSLRSEESGVRGKVWVHPFSEWDWAQDPRIELATGPCYFDSNIEYIFKVILGEKEAHIWCFRGKTVFIKQYNPYRHMVWGTCHNFYKYYWDIQAEK